MCIQPMPGFIAWYCSNVSRGVKPWRDDVAGVEDQHQRRVVHLLVDLGHQLAVLADEVGFDLQAERQVAAVAGLGDLAELIDRLRQVARGSVPRG